MTTTLTGATSSTRRAAHRTASPAWIHSPRCSPSCLRGFDASIRFGETTHQCAHASLVTCASYPSPAGAWCRRGPERGSGERAAAAGAPRDCRGGQGGAPRAQPSTAEARFLSATTHPSLLGFLGSQKVQKNTTHSHPLHPPAQFKGKFSEELDAGRFRALVKQYPVLLVNFYAPWRAAPAPADAPPRPPFAAFFAQCGCARRRG